VMQFVPKETSEFFSTQLLSPVLNAFMGFLGAMSGPMICLSVVWGIYSIGDAVTFSVLGKRLISRYIIVITAVGVVSLAIFIPLFTFDMSADSSSVIFGQLLQMVLDIVPSNLFMPFTEGNTLQILFVGIIIGLAMLYVSEKTQSVAILMEQVNIIVQIIMDVITRLVPAFVFGSLLDIILSDSLSGLATSYKLFVGNIGGCIGLIILYTAWICIRMKMHPGVLLKKALPTFIIGVTTASSSAAFATNRKTCSEEYGIKQQLADFGVPFGQVIFKPSVAIFYLTSALCAAEIYGVSTAGAWLVAATLMSIILSVATPPIPGGALASFTVLFSQLGIPVDAIAIVLALNIVLDFIETPTDLFGGQCMLILAARNFKMIDADVLRSGKAALQSKKKKTE